MTDRAVDDGDDDDVDLFEDAKPRPPIEHRAWVDDPEEVKWLVELGPKIKGSPSGRCQRYDAQRYADMLARQTARRDLMALRREIERWASDWAHNHEEDDPEFSDALGIMRDVVTVLDERIASRGGVDRDEPE